MKARILKLGSFVMVTLLLLVACSTSDTGQPTTVAPVETSQSTESTPAAERQRGFDSPEDAVVAYLEGLRELDFGQMINAFAVETHVEHFDLEAFLDRLRIYDLRGGTMFPDTNEFTTALNIEIRRGEVAHWIRSHYIILTHPELAADREYPEDIQIWQPIEEGGANDFIHAFMEILNAPAFYNLEILGFIPPELNERYVSEINQENMARNAKFLGADELVSRTAVFELDGHKYFLLVDLASYDGRWFLSRVGGFFAMVAGISWDLHGLMIIPPQYLDELFGGMLENIVTEW